MHAESEWAVRCLSEEAVRFPWIGPDSGNNHAFGPYKDCPEAPELAE
jgi:hypothetical protein